MANRWLKTSLVVAVAFAFTVICLLVARWAPLYKTSFLFFLLTVPGFAITELCFGPDLLRTSPLASECLVVAFNTLIYSGLFGAVLMVSGSRRQTAQSTSPLLNADAEGSQAAPVAVAPRLLTRRKLATVLGLIPLLILLYFFVGFTFTRVPPILVRVVDAISGRPIAGIEVTQRLETEHPGEVSQPPPKVTGSNGYVLFRPYVHWNGLSIFSTVFGYSIAVNENSMATKPWRREIDLGPHQTDKYFPVILQTRCPNCVLLWRAPDPARLNLGSSWLVTVPLIPALDSPDKCSSIANPTVSKQCKELNTYRSAFLHFDSIQDVENNKSICKRLKDQAAKTCLDDLHGYILHAMDKPSLTYPSPFKARQMPMLPTLPLSEVFPFERIGDREIMRRNTWGNDVFSGHVGYSATYARGGRLSSEIQVRIDVFPTEDTAQQAFSALSSSRFDYNPKTTISDEIRSRNRIKVVRGTNPEHAFWRSANKVVEVLINFPVPEDEEAVSKYLTLYPSSLTQNDFTKTQVYILGEKSPFHK